MPRIEGYDIFFTTPDGQSGHETVAEPDEAKAKAFIKVKYNAEIQSCRPLDEHFLRSKGIEPGSGASKSWVSRS